MEVGEELRGYCDNPGIRFCWFRPRRYLWRWWEKQLCSRYILKVDPTKFAGQLNVSYER